MDLDKLVTQDLANEGQWFPVELYGKPADFDLRILGDDSDAVQQHSRRAMKKLRSVMSRPGKANEDGLGDEAVDELAESGDEAVLVRIAGIRGWKVEREGPKAISRQPEPVTLNGKELGNDKESFKLLVSKIPAIREFVLGKARDRTNFLS